MITRGNWQQTLAPGLRKFVLQWEDWAMKDSEYSKIFNVHTSDRAYEEDVEAAGTPPAVLTGEGSPIPFYDPVQGGSIRYTHMKYALGTQISEEALEDDQYGVLKKVPDAHARSHRFIEEQVAANVINNGFSTTVTTDGLSLFNDEHPLLGGTAATSALPLPSTSYVTAGTYPNSPTTAVDISQSAVQAMLNQFKRLVDGVGMPLNIMPKFLLVPPEKEYLAAEVLGSAFKPGTANNDINAVLKFGLGYFTFTYSTSATAWFALSDKSAHQLNFFRRTPLKTDFADDFNINAFKMKSYQRFSAGATTWPGTWGTNPS